MARILKIYKLDIINNKCKFKLIILEQKLPKTLPLREQGFFIRSPKNKPSYFAYKGGLLPLHV